MLKCKYFQNTIDICNQPAFRIHTPQKYLNKFCCINIKYSSFFIKNILKRLHPCYAYIFIYILVSLILSLTSIINTLTFMFFTYCKALIFFSFVLFYYIFYILCLRGLVVLFCVCFFLFNRLDVNTKNKYFLRFFFFLIFLVRVSYACRAKINILCTNILPPLHTQQQCFAKKIFLEIC